MRKEFQMAASAQEVRDHLLSYCTGLGFKPTSAESPMRFERGSAFGSFASTSPNRWQARLTATVNPLPDGKVTVVLEEEVNTTGQLRNKKEKLYLSREFDGLFASPSFARSVPSQRHEGAGFSEEISKMERQFKGGASWFFWIAGLSLVNSLIFHFGGATSFLAGLGVTQLIDGIAVGLKQDLDPPLGSLMVPLALGADLLLAGYYVILGVLARRRSKLSFVLGTGSYVVDALIFLIVPDFWSIGFHLFVLIFLIAGMNGLARLNDLEKVAKVNRSRT